MIEHGTARCPACSAVIPTEFASPWGSAGPAVKSFMAHREWVGGVWGQWLQCPASYSPIDHGPRRPLADFVAHPERREY